MLDEGKVANQSKVLGRMGGRGGKGEVELSLMTCGSSSLHHA